MTLNEKQKLAFDEILNGQNVFISGPGGVGKSFLTRYIVDKFPKDTVVLAPTGIAALNIGGSTIHSTFSFPHSVINSYAANRISGKTESVFNKNTSPVKRIIIDEISMVRIDLFAAMDVNLRKIRRTNKPFGGLQVICVGDFYQLPPVLTRDEIKAFEESGYHRDHTFAFCGETWSQSKFKHIELDQIMRQSDVTLISHLQNIRRKTSEYKNSVMYFNDLSIKNASLIDDQSPTYLCSTNKAAGVINKTFFDELEGETKTFYGEKEGHFVDYPVPQKLELKFGTKVIFCINSDSYKNGELGYVTGFTGEYIEVTKDNHNEDTILVPRAKWESKEYTVASGELKTVVTGKYIQFPLKHAWAVTIHKAQGTTLPSAVIDLGRGAFTSGQTYVALSRIKEPDGIHITDEIRYNDVIVDKNITKFYDNGCRGIGLF